MITYAYWFAVLAVAVLALGVLGFRMDRWKSAAAVAGIVLVAGWGAYTFHFRQLFVKRWGGVMVVRNQDGFQHLASTWKEDNLWIESYDPATNTCHFREYARGNLLEGQVTIRDCNPLAR